MVYLLKSDYQVISMAQSCKELCGQDEQSGALMISNAAVLRQFPI